MDKTQVGFWRWSGEILRLTVTPASVTWNRIRRIRFHAERTGKPAVFSTVGLSAEGWRFTIRAQDLRITDALRIGQDHYFLTSIQEIPDRIGFLTVDAAKINLVQCTAGKEREEPGPSFPAALTEKYLRHEQHRPDAVNLICYVLVTPKCINLEPGSLVDVDGEAYEVLVAHRLDGVKNEYEIYRKADL